MSFNIPLVVAHSSRTSDREKFFHYMFSRQAIACEVYHNGFIENGQIIIYRSRIDGYFFLDP